MTYSDDQKKRYVGQAWGGVFTAVVIALGVGYWLYQRGPQVVPPPVNNTSEVTDALTPGCSLEAVAPGGEVDILDVPRRDGMVIHSVPHGQPLSVESVRVDWVEVSAPERGFVSRRHVREVCP